MCFRQMRRTPDTPVLRVPHPVVYSSKARKGYGFSPKELQIPGLPVTGQVVEEDPYDASGNVKPGYQCSTRSTRDCVEQCVLDEMPYQMAGPPNYSTAARWMGGNQCTDWAEGILRMCEQKCSGK